MRALLLSLGAVESVWNEDRRVTLIGGRHAGIKDAEIRNGR